MANYADRKWKDEFFVLAYRLAREGRSENLIAAEMGVGVGVLRRWKQQRPALAEALEKGKSATDKALEKENQLFYRLPAHVRDVWDRIKGAEEDPADEAEVARDKRRLRALLDDEVGKLPKKDKQRLYLFAVSACRYSNSAACSLVGVSSQTVRVWRAEDPEFRELVRELVEAKKDEVESALFELIEQREPSAVIFAAKTQLRDRGYSDKVEIRVTGDPEYSVDSLGLSLEEQRLLLAKIREAETKRLPAPDHEVPDAEIVEVREVEK